MTSTAATTIPHHCQHYRCRRTDIAPYLYVVLGATFARWLCCVHAPKAR